AAALAQLLRLPRRNASARVGRRRRLGGGRGVGGRRRWRRARARRGRGGGGGRRGARGGARARARARVRLGRALRRDQVLQVVDSVLERGSDVRVRLGGERGYPLLQRRNCGRSEAGAVRLLAAAQALRVLQVADQVGRVRRRNLRSRPAAA